MAAKDYQRHKPKPHTDQGRQRRANRRREARNRRQMQHDLNWHTKFGAAEDYEIERWVWRVSLLQGDDKGHLTTRRISGLVTALQWSDTNEYLTGNITLNAPDKWVNKKAYEKLTIRDGDVVILEVSHRGRWHELWRMRMYSPQEDLGGKTITSDLSTDLRLAQEGNITKTYDKSKKTGHPKGWLCHEIAADVFKYIRMKVTRLAVGTHYITNQHAQDEAPLSVVLKAYQDERDATGRHFVVGWKGSGVSITPLRLQRYMFALRRQITAATVGNDRSGGGGGFATALMMVGNVKQADTSQSGKAGGGKGKDAKGGKSPHQITALVINKAAVARYGYIQSEHKLDSNVESKAELITKGKQILSQMLIKRTINTISLSHRGIPFIRKGDAVEINLPEYGFKNKPKPWKVFHGGTYDILFVTAVTHSISATDYTMDLTFGVEDPLIQQEQDIKEAAAKAAREKKRKEHGRNHSAGKPQSGDSGGVDTGSGSLVYPGSDIYPDPSLFPG